MECRPGCGACCIAPSITSPIPGMPGMPGMPGGKPAGVRCVQLDNLNRCRLFDSTLRPAVCGGFPPHPDSCGSSNAAALSLLTELERLTAR